MKKILLVIFLLSISFSTTAYDEMGKRYWWGDGSISRI